MGVDINVDLDVDIEDGIKKIKKRLRSINDEVDFDDIKVHHKKEEDSDTDSLLDRDREAKDRDKDLGLIDPTVDFDGIEGGDESRLLGRDCCDRIVRHLQSLRDTVDTGNVNLMKRLERISRDRADQLNVTTGLGDIGDDDSGGGGTTEGDDDGDIDRDDDGGNDFDIKDMVDNQMNQQMDIDDLFDFSGSTHGFDFGGMVEFEKINKSKKEIDGLNHGLSRVGRTLGKLKPSMKAFHTILALSMPLIIGAGAQLAGLATGLIAVAGAGAAVGVLGMLGGQADTLQGSVKGAQNRLQEFKRELFQVFEPVADQFAPFTERMLEGALSGARELKDEIADLETFTEVFGSLGSGLLGGFEGMLQVIVDLAPALKRVTQGFGEWFENNAPGFLRGVIETGLRARDVLDKFAGILFHVLRLILEISTLVVEFVTIFSFFIPILSFVADLLGNKFVRAIILAISVGGVMLVTVSKLAAALTWMATSSTLAMIANKGLIGSIAHAIGALYAKIAAVWQLNAALGVLATLLVAATAGFAALTAVGGIAAMGDTLTPDIPDGPGGGAGTTGGSGGGIGGGAKSGGGDFNVYIQGDADNDALETFKDENSKWEDRKSMGNGTALN